MDTMHHHLGTTSRFDARALVASIAIASLTSIVGVGCDGAADDCERLGTCSPGGAAGGAGGGSVTPTTVVSTTPSDGATGVTTGIIVSATFSAPIDPQSCSSLALTLESSSGEPITGVAECEGDRVAFAPSSALTLLDGYTASLSATLRDVAGYPISVAPSWSFTTRDGVWGGAELAPSTPGQDHDIAHSDAGTMLVGSDEASVWAMRHGVDSGWDAVETLEQQAGVLSYAIAVAMNDEGDAVVVWPRHVGSDFDRWAAVYTHGSGWSDAVLIGTSSDLGVATSEVVMDPSGHASVVWPALEGSSYRIKANRYIPGSGWVQARTIGYDADTFVQLHLVADGQDNAVAVWRAYVGNQWFIRASRFTAETSWSDPVDLASHPGMPSLVSVDGSRTGGTLVVWRTYGSADDTLWARRYTGSGWKAAEIIAGIDLTDPAVAMNDAGDAIVAWMRQDADGHQPWALLSTAERGWGQAEPIGTGGMGVMPSGAVHVTMSEAGDALAVWSQRDGAFADLWSNRSSIAGGWGEPVRIEDHDAGEATLASLAVDPRGHAVAVAMLEANNGVYDLAASRFVAGSGWGGMHLVESAPEWPYPVGPVGIDGLGRARTIFLQGGELWTATFTDPTVP